MFEIVDDLNKRIVISLHLEQIYSAFCLREQIEGRMELFSLEQITLTCLDNLELINIEPWREEYEFIIDFFHIIGIEDNQQNRFKKWIDKLPNKKICNFNAKGKIKQFINLETSDEDYREAFNYYGKNFILKNCCEPDGYTTQVGIELGVYINLKNVIVNTKEMVRWCYIIAYDLNKNYFFKIKNKNKKVLLFCHTLNGSNIAGVISQLLDCNLIYVDHLGPYNKLNKVNFYKDMYEPTEYIIIADLVCLGNEILRAKNIVEYLGGTVKGYAGMLRLDISDISIPNGVEAFALNYSAETARSELKYTIRTKLCASNCNV